MNGQVSLFFLKNEGTNLEIHSTPPCDQPVWPFPLWSRNWATKKHWKGLRWLPPHFIVQRLWTAILDRWKLNEVKFGTSYAKGSQDFETKWFLFLTFKGYGSTMLWYIRSYNDIQSLLGIFLIVRYAVKKLKTCCQFFNQKWKYWLFQTAHITIITTFFSSLKTDRLRARSLPVELAEHTYLRNKDQHDGITLQIDDNLEILPSILWISACQINQMANENDYKGLLTACIKHTWSGGNFKGNYSSFFSWISLAMPPTQSPKLHFLVQIPHVF